MVGQEQMNALKIETGEAMVGGILNEGVGQSGTVVRGGHRGRPVDATIPTTDGQNGFDTLMRTDELGTISRWHTHVGHGGGGELVDY